jgi:hypothetical protein
MKKVIKLTESDLVKIVKRVIEEQITDKGTIPSEIKKIHITGDTLSYLNDKFKVNLKQQENSDTFMDKLNNSPIKIKTFMIPTESGYSVRIFPVSLEKKLTNSTTFKFSFEPFDKEHGIYSLRLIKNF